jgi:hypothetical protein
MVVRFSSIGTLLWKKHTSLARRGRQTCFYFPVLKLRRILPKIIFKTLSSLKNPLCRQRPILAANSILTITNKLDTPASFDLTSSSYLSSLKYSRNSIFDTIFAKTQASCKRHPSRILNKKRSQTGSRALKPYPAPIS